MKKFVILLLTLALITSFGAVMAAEDPVPGGTFHRGITTNPRGMFNPILYDAVYDGYVVTAVFDGLVAIDEELVPVPRLAESWEFSEDGLSLTFYLQEDAIFHDGVPVTAEDVKFTIEAICHPDYTGVRFGDFRPIKGAEAYKAGEVDYVEGIEIIDDHTIRFTTDEPFAPFLTRFTYGILPAHHFEDVAIGEMEYAKFNEKPIGAGPFKFREFRSDRYVMMEAFDDYYRDGPYLDRYVINIVSEDAVPIYLRQGRIDFAGLLPEQVPTVEPMDLIDVYDYEALSYSYIAFNLRQERFDDRRVRQAMKYAFDRESRIDVVLDGFGIPANAPMPTASWAFTDEGIDTYPYNPDRARELLEEAGWEPGRDGILEKDGMRLEIEFLIAEGRVAEMTAVLFQEQMADVGIKVNIRPMDFTAAVDRIDAREFDIFMLGWSLGTDPDPYGIWHSTSPWNDPGFYHERSDELIEKGRREMDMEKRAEIYAEWQRIINRELPYIFLNYSVSLAAANHRLQGVDRDPGPQGLLVDLARIWIPAEYQ